MRWLSTPPHRPAQRTAPRTPAPATANIADANLLTIAAAEDVLEMDVTVTLPALLLPALVAVVVPIEMLAVTVEVIVELLDEVLFRAAQILAGMVPKTMMS